MKGRCRQLANSRTSSLEHFALTDALPTGKAHLNQSGSLPYKDTFSAVYMTHGSPANLDTAERLSSRPWKTQTPEMELLLLFPKMMTLAKPFFLSLSNLEHFSDKVANQKVLGELFRKTVFTIPQIPVILTKWTPKYGNATERVFVGVLKLKSSNTKVLLAK